MRVVVGKLLSGLLCLAAVSLLAFAAIAMMPGDFVDELSTGNPDATPEEIARLRKLLGEETPLMARYGQWLAGIARGDLGMSRVSHQPVASLLATAMVNTLLLSGLALLLATVLGVTLGLLAAWRPHTRLAGLVAMLGHAGVAIPGFWLGLLLIHVFAIKLGVLPSGGLADAGSPHSTAAHFVLPVLTLVILFACPLLSHTRAALEVVRDEDYVRTARAKGLCEWRVAVHHGLRTAASPVVTCIGINMGELFSGATLIETIFAWPGMGRLLTDAVLAGDTRVAASALLVITATVMAAGGLADLVARALDPRFGRGAAG